MLAVAIRDDGRRCGAILRLQAVQVQGFGLLPGEALATKVTVATGRLVDGLAQLQFSVGRSRTRMAKHNLTDIQNIIAFIKQFGCGAH